ncbi:MAG: rhodanese-like domain-containing protein [Candidatus Moranbacteria bacterium]|nr:rhodanese-like domain-containing protein [Candidatus Moranbacteria bacterium]
MVNVWIKVSFCYYIYMKKNHLYILISIFILTGGLLYFLIPSSKCQGSECEIKEEQQVRVFEEYKEMNPDTLPSKVSSGEVFLLDVRELSEWNEGYIDGAKHLALGMINSENTLNFPKDKPIYIYCRSGRRAVEAETKLKNLGFNNALTIGGISQWIERDGKIFIKNR